MNMNATATATATFRGNFIPISSLCSSCCGDLPRIYALPISNIASRNAIRCQSSKSIFRSGKRKFVCRVSEAETEPESENDKDNQVHEDTEESPSPGPKVESNRTVESQPADVDQIKEQLAKLNMLISDNVTVDSQPATVDQTKNQLAKLDMLISDKVTVDSQPAAVDQNQPEKLDMLSSDNTVNNTAGETKAQDSNEDFDNIEVASGSPLPGVKLGDSERIPKETIDILKGEVFGFDTFFVTSHEPYEGGALFKGNLRGTAAKSYEKINKRLEDKFGDQFKLFLLNNPEDDKPVAVVVPRKILQPETTAVPEWFAAASFGVVTLFTLLLRNVPDLQSNLLSTFDNVNLLKDGLPGALVTALILGVHEISHILVANSSGVKLGVPYFVPSWQIGSFGTITRIINIVPKREDLLKIAAAGPLAGFFLGIVLLLLGFIVPPSNGLGAVVDGSVFHESFLAGIIAKLFLGDALKEGTPVSLNPLVLWAWAGLLINAINSIPAGELDGGRISFAIWGRKGSARLTGASIVLLGLSSLINDVAFYWVVLIFFLQRGPIAPLSEEITEPDNKYVALGIAVLFLGLLVCLPYPFPFTTEAIASF